MIFGTFDVIHPGHEHLFRQARALARPAQPILIVSVARDKNVRRIKGYPPIHREGWRVAVLRRHPLVDRVVLGALGDHLPHIIRERPDIIALGYDQRAYVTGLRMALQQKGLPVKIVRLKSHHPHKYKTSLLRKKI